MSPRVAPQNQMLTENDVSRLFIACHHLYLERDQLQFYT